MTPNRICFIGDSITVGYADEDGLGWPARLCQGLMIGTRPVTCYNLGINGDTSRDVAQRWRSEIEARSRDGGPGLLVFAFGFNDAATRVGEGQQIALGTSSDIARAVIGEAQTLAPVLWIGPTPCNENINPMTDAGVTWEMWNADIAEYSQTYAGIAAELGVPYIDLTPTLVADGRYTASLAAGDGMHPGSDGCARIAEIVADWNAWQEAIS